MRVLAFVAVSRPIAEMNDGCPKVEPITAFEKPKLLEPKQIEIIMNTNLVPKCRRPCSGPAILLASWAVIVQVVGRQRQEHVPRLKVETVFQQSIERKIANLAGRLALPTRNRSEQKYTEERYLGVYILAFSLQALFTQSSIHRGPIGTAIPAPSVCQQRCQQKTHKPLERAGMPGVCRNLVAFQPHVSVLPD